MCAKPRPGTAHGATLVSLCFWPERSASRTARHEPDPRKNMQEKKTLTFVVPAYNMTEYLERCVESLIAS